MLIVVLSVHRCYAKGTRHETIRTQQLKSEVCVVVLSVLVPWSCHKDLIMIYYINAISKKRNHNKENIKINSIAKKKPKQKHQKKVLVPWLPR